MKNIIIIFMIVATASFASCDYLSIDKYFGDELKLDSVFSNKRYTLAYLWDIASQFPDEANDAIRGGVTPGPLATDEAFTAFAEDRGSYPGLSYVLGRYSASDLGQLNQWGSMYRIIRRCNTVLARSREAVDMTPTELILVNSYARFMRAYAYYRLVVNIGPPIIVYDEVVSNNEMLEYYDRPRDTYDVAVDYICKEFEEAARYLPVEQSVMEQGRPTKGAAYGLVARLRLIQASPLYNGGDAARYYFNQWKRKKDGVHYVSQTYDERRWAVAAAAAKRVIDMGVYELYTALESSFVPARPMPLGITSDPDYYKPWPVGAAGIDHFKSYSDVFTGEAVLQTNPEMVWGRNTGAVNSGNQASFPKSNGGWNGMCVTQKVVDAYAMFDGRTIDNSSDEYPYDEEIDFSSAQDNFSGYRLNAGTYNMYVNREMRFYASIGFHNRYWPLRSATNTGIERTILYNRSSSNGRAGSIIEYPPTGYVIVKYIHVDDAFQGDNNRRLPKTFGMIRYAEILLSYAEALNNLTTSHTVEVDGVEQTFSRDTEAIRLAFGKVRHRSGQPAPSAGELANAVTMQQLVERERMIEFLFENRRYYDVRRWGKYEETEYETIMGMNTEGDDEAYFRRTMPSTNYAKSRIVNRKFVLLPLPLNEVRRLPLLDQNPGWEE